MTRGFDADGSPLPGGPDFSPCGRNRQKHRGATIVAFATPLRAGSENDQSDKESLPAWERAGKIMAEPYRVVLSDLFEGPMDLLVHLIKKNELPIYDIPIALITEKYLDYLKWMDAMNVEYASEFIVLAATLTQIKSRMLLPVHEGEEEEEDPRQELIQPLLEYLQMKSAAEQLGQRDLLGDATFTRQPDHRDFLTNPDEQIIKVGLFELIDAFQRILEKIPEGVQIDFSADEVSVKEKISEIAEILEARGSVTFDELFPEVPTRKDVIATFLAILEMVKLEIVRLAQHVDTGIIRLFYI